MIPNHTHYQTVLRPVDGHFVWTNIIFSYFIVRIFNRLNLMINFNITTIIESEPNVFTIIAVIHKAKFLAVFTYKII